MCKASKNRTERTNNLRYLIGLTPDADRKAFLGRVLEAFEAAPLSAHAGMFHGPIADWSIEDRTRAYRLYCLGAMIATPSISTGVRA